MGIAAGNLLGLPVESQSHHRIAAKYPVGVRDISPREVARRMDDDPAQAIELDEALLDEGNTVGLFAKRLIAWSLTNGRGMGRTTRQSIAQLADGMEPPHAAYAVYRAKGGIAPNGGIMRCAPVATYYRTQPELLTRMSAATCTVTHYSPLSQWSCVVANVAIAMLLGGYEPDLQKLLAAAKADGCPDLLAAGRKSGIHRLDATGRAVGRDDATGLRRITGRHSERRRRHRHQRRAGRSGAGTRHGASTIPLRWTAYIAQRERLADLGERLLAR